MNTNNQIDAEITNLLAEIKRARERFNDRTRYISSDATSEYIHKINSVNSTLTSLIKRLDKINT